MNDSQLIFPRADLGETQQFKISRGSFKLPPGNEWPWFDTDNRRASIEEMDRRKGGTESVLYTCLHCQTTIIDKEEHARVCVRTIDTNSYIFNFGKYRGEAYNDVLHQDPAYIYWCHHNVEWFTLNKNDFPEYEKVMDKFIKWRGSGPHRAYECGDFGYQHDWGAGPQHILGDS